MKTGLLMEKQLLQVNVFHNAIGEKVAESPELLETDNDTDQALARGLRDLIEKTRSGQQPGSHLSRRAVMAIEELAEWIEAHIRCDMVEAADAIGDRLYVLLGDAVATGLPLERVFEEAHCSNMTKHAVSPETGKGTKTEVFAAPQLGKLLETSPSDSQKTCLSCRFKLWMVGIGQGFKCKHPDNRTAEGEYMAIPNRNFSCDRHEVEINLAETSNQNA